MIGDCILVRGDTWVAWCIRFGTQSQFAHVATDVGDGELAEAMPEGMQLAPIDKYANKKGTKVLENDPIWKLTVEKLAAKSITTTEQALREAVAGNARRFVKEKRGYNWWDIWSIALYQWGIKPPFIRHIIKNLRRLICSQAYDLEAQLAGVQEFDDGRLNQDVTPEDLYYAYILRVQKASGAYYVPLDETKDVW